MTEEDAVSLCARAILHDLLPKHRPVKFSELVYLCEIRGGRPLVDPDISAREGGKCIQGEIILSPYCTLDQYRQIIPHELVHRLADTPRWEELNYELPPRPRNRSQFLEAVATRVGENYDRICHLRRNAETPPR